MQSPNAALIIIGNEILSGRTQDTNLRYLATALNALGIRLAHARVIPDIEEIIIETVTSLRETYTYVFTTGGIGPTHDDITSASVAKAYGVALLRHPEAERRLRSHYKPEDLNAARLKMADIPAGATLIDNPISTAPGFRIGNLFVMAGVPAIMQAMFDNVKGELKGGAPMLSRTLNVNLPEGTFAEGLTALQDRYVAVEIGSYPHFQQGRVSSSLVFRCTDAALLEAAVQECRQILLALQGEVSEA